MTAHRSCDGLGWANRQVASRASASQARGSGKHTTMLRGWLQTRTKLLGPSAEPARPEVGRLDRALSQLFASGQGEHSGPLAGAQSASAFHVLPIVPMRDERGETWHTSRCAKKGASRRLGIGNTRSAVLPTWERTRGSFDSRCRFKRKVEK